MRATKIEKLSARHPGLRTYIAMRLDGGAGPTEILKDAKKRFGAELTRSAVQQYKLKRWLPATQRVQALVEQSEAILRIIEEYGPDRAALAYIFEQLSAARERGESPAPAVLLKEQREHAKLALQRDIAKAEQQRKDRELKFKQTLLRKRRAGASEAQAHEAEASPGQEASAIKPFDAAKVYRDISAVIGVGGAPETREEPE